jgi:hypothetical protein
MMLERDRQQARLDELTRHFDEGGIETTKAHREEAFDIAIQYGLEVPVWVRA